VRGELGDLVSDDTGIDEVPRRDEEDGSIALPVSVPGDVRAVDTLRLAFAFGTRSRKHATTIYGRGRAGRARTSTRAAGAKTERRSFLGLRRPLSSAVAV
jgi:hypothetical protein